jgi:hypothetical protein
MSHIMELILMDRWMADITYMSSTTKWTLKLTVRAYVLFRFQTLRLQSSDMLQSHESIKPCIEDAFVQCWSSLIQNSCSGKSEGFIVFQVSVSMLLMWWTVTNLNRPFEGTDGMK